MLTAGNPPKSPGSVMFVVTQLLAASRTYNQKPNTDLDEAQQIHYSIYEVQVFTLDTMETWSRTATRPPNVT